MVHCNDNGFWGSPFFYDACMQACPTQPTLPPTTTTTVLPDPAFVDYSELAEPETLAEIAELWPEFAELVPLEDPSTSTPFPTGTLPITEDPELRAERERAESRELSGRDGIMASTMWSFGPRVKGEGKSDKIFTKFGEKSCVIML